MRPIKKGQRFTTSIIDGLLNVKYFFGKSGVEYDTYEEARKANPSGYILIRPVGSYGAVEADLCELAE